MTRRMTKAAAIRVEREKYWSTSERRNILTNYSLERLRDVIQEVVRISPLLARLSEPIVSIRPIRFNFDTPEKWSELEEPKDWQVFLRWDDNMAFIDIVQVRQMTYTLLGVTYITKRQTKAGEDRVKGWCSYMEKFHGRGLGAVMTGSRGEA